MRRAARIFSVALVTAGFVLLVDAGITIAWKEPLSAVYSKFRQSAATDELDRARRDFLEDPEVLEIGRTRDLERQTEQLAAVYGRRLGEGDPFGRIEVPSVNIDYVVVQGTDTATLQQGPGHYPTTALPGEGKTIAVAGHRTTYGAPFNRIDDIEPGDSITLEMPYATFTYEVTEERIVDPKDVGVVDDIGVEQLVLTACHPLYSAAQRYVIFAELADLSLLPGSAGRGAAP
jgi:sortase A